MFSDIRTVFLDLDDTLWWFTRNSDVAFALVCRQYGVDRWCAGGTDRFADIYHRINADLWHRYHHGEITRDQLIGVRYRLTLQQAGYTGADIDTLAPQMDHDYLELLAQQPLAVPGARHLLEHLGHRGYTVGVLSNGFKSVQRRKLESAGLSHLVPLLVLSDDCGITKPQRGIFDYALSQAHADAATTVMIGDDPDADILGARQAGWRTIYFNAKNRPAIKGTADAEVAALSDITRLL